MQSALEIARTFFDEVWTKRRREAIAELSAPYAVGYLPFGGTKHISDVEAFHDAMLHACPDFTLVAEEVIANGEHAAVRWLAKGTHQRDALGIVAKNRPVEVRGVTWFRIKDGKIVEAWDCWDQGGLVMKWAEE